MAANFLVPLLIPLGEELANVTQLVGGESVKFPRSSYRLQVPEDTRLGSLITLAAEAVNTDLPVHYYMYMGSEHFSVDQMTGVVSLTTHLDYEKQLKHVVTVRASLPNSSIFTDTILTISVTDVNDNAPKFSHSLLEAQITEEDGRNLPRDILTVHADDFDSEKFAVVRYSLEGERTITYRHLPTADMEERRKQSGNSSSHWSNRLFSHRSSYPSTKKRLSGMKSHITGYDKSNSVTTDLLDPGGLDFYFNSDPLFAIDSITGTISVLQPLDRDPPTGKPFYNLKVLASDGLFTSKASVVINLKDINDNAPKFQRDTVRCKIMENEPADTFVTTVAATDADDSDNSLLEYSLLVNAVHSHSNNPVFRVEKNTGSIYTAICCLDRETTAIYELTLVVSDGGGLKGSCTVIVDVDDVNDVGPRWSRKDLTIEVEEHNQAGKNLAIFTVRDPDVANEFHFRVFPSAPVGWYLTKVSPNSSGDIRVALRTNLPLDYEDKKQRGGFDLKLQVTDRLPNNWDSFTDTSEITVTLLDVNDNSPLFNVTGPLQRTVAEDCPVGHTVINVSAMDKDQGKNGEVTYQLDSSSDPREHFSVDSNGTVRVARPLDRETKEKYLLKIVAEDGGEPTLSSEIILEVIVRDINDNPPEFEKSQILTNKKSLDQLVFTVGLSDSDDWSLGNGPPFKVTLDPSQDTSKLFQLVVDRDKVTFSLKEKWPEDAPQVTVYVLASDSGDPMQRASLPVTVTVTDASSYTIRRTLQVYVIDNILVDGESSVPLGKACDPSLSPEIHISPLESRGSVRYSWLTQTPPQNFILNHKTGNISLSSLGKTLRTELKIFVQLAPRKSFLCLMEVSVDFISRSDVTKAVPVDIEYNNEDKSQNMLEAVSIGGKFLVDEDVDVKVVSIQKLLGLNATTSVRARLWIVSTKQKNLQLVLQLNKNKIEKEVKGRVLGIGLHRIGKRDCEEDCQCCCNPTIKIIKEYSSTHSPVHTLIGPDLNLKENCRCIQMEKSSNITSNHRVSTHLESSNRIPEQPFAHAMTNKNVNGRLPDCITDTCLNGGRCVPSQPGYRCICPHKTAAPRCKILSRHFYNTERQYRSWALLPPLNPCSKFEFSIEILTKSANGPILSSGLSEGSGYSLFLIDGTPHFHLLLGEKKVVVSVDIVINDYKWHNVQIVWRNKLLEVTIDHCSDGAVPCYSSSKYFGPSVIVNTEGEPILLGYFPMAESHSYTNTISGCMKNLRINGELQDLGHSLLSFNSVPHCNLMACDQCPLKSKCNGSPGSESCTCSTGWRGEECQKQTQPIRFGPKSFVQLTLFASDYKENQQNVIELRFRTRSSNVLILALRSSSGKENFVLDLRRGQICLSLNLQHEVTTYSSVCLSVSLNDGAWHSVEAARYQRDLSLKADHTDSEYYRTKRLQFFGEQTKSQDAENDRLLLALNSPTNVKRRSTLLRNVTRQSDRDMIYTNFKNGCLDDLRINGQSIPIYPKSEKSSVKLEAFKDVHYGCSFKDSCSNVTCNAPFECVDTWQQFQCQCPIGSSLSANRSTCEDVDECMYAPCLNQGTCSNYHKGYRCLCLPSFSGNHCEFPIRDYHLLLPFAIIGVTLLFTIVAVLVVCFSAHKLKLITIFETKNKDNRSKVKSKASSKVPQTDTSFTTLPAMTPSDRGLREQEVDLLPKVTPNHLMGPQKSNSVAGLKGFSSHQTKVWLSATNDPFPSPSQSYSGRPRNDSEFGDVQTRDLCDYNTLGSKHR